MSKYKSTVKFELYSRILETQNAQTRRKTFHPEMYKQGIDPALRDNIVSRIRIKEWTVSNNMLFQIDTKQDKPQETKRYLDKRQTTTKSRSQHSPPGPSLKTRTDKKTKEIPTILSLMFDWKLHHAVSLQARNQTVQLPCYNFCQTYAFPQTPMMK